MNNQMLKSAIWYAQHGWYVLPIHEPIFVNGVCVGCTCEPYRHSDECKRNNPRMYLAENDKCDNPGKAITPKTNSGYDYESRSEPNERVAAIQ